MIKRRIHKVNLSNKGQLYIIFQKKYQKEVSENG